MTARCGRWRVWAGRLALLAAGAAAARVALVGARRATEHGDQPTRRWARQNYQGRSVNLVGGPALAAAATVTAAAGAPGRAPAVAVLVAGGTAGAVGLYDDLVGARPEQQAKGLRGHLTALRHGRVTSGVVKLLGVSAAGLSAVALLDHARAAGRAPTPRDLAGVVVGAGVVAGSANLLNLLDLRPGRALKVALLIGLPLTRGHAGALAAGPVGAAAGALPEDLSARTMLGDCGANALGALLGVALVQRTGVAGRAAALTVIAALTVASERVSFTQVIARTPGLRQLDELGRARGDETAPRLGPPDR